MTQTPSEQWKEEIRKTIYDDFPNVFVQDAIPEIISLFSSLLSRAQEEYIQIGYNRGRQRHILQDPKDNSLEAKYVEQQREEARKDILKFIHDHETQAQILCPDIHFGEKIIQTRTLLKYLTPTKD